MDKEAEPRQSNWQATDLWHWIWIWIRVRVWRLETLPATRYPQPVRPNNETCNMQTGSQIKTATNNRTMATNDDDGIQLELNWMKCCKIPECDAVTVRVRDRVWFRVWIGIEIVVGFTIRGRCRDTLVKLGDCL